MEVRLQISVSLFLFSCMGAPSDPCADMTVRECGIASHLETTPSLRAQLAAASREAGDPEGCSSLGLQLLLNSADDTPRRNAAYSAFHRSCGAQVEFLCLQPMFAELHSEAPNADFVVNGFQASCARNPYEWCHLVPPIKERLGVPVSQAALDAAKVYDDGMPYFDISEVLATDFQWARRPHLLVELPTDTPGNLWTYGMDDAQ